VDKRSKDILNAPYFHVVFTVPRQLHSLIYQNQEVFYGLMYKAVAETLAELSKDKKYLGARIGFFPYCTHGDRTCAIIRISMRWFWQAG